MNSSLLEEIVGDTVREFKKNVVAKLRDMNNFKVNLSGENKLYQSYPIHRLVFARSFGCNFTPKEGTYPSFEVRTLHRFGELFGDKAIIKINAFGDLALATPVNYVDQIDDNDKISHGDTVFH